MIAATDVSPDSIQQAFYIFLDFGFKSLLLCAAALLLDRALGRRVLARSTMLYACLLGLALLPAASLAFPTVRLNIGSEREVGALSRFAPRNDVLSQSERRQTGARQPEQTAPEPRHTKVEPLNPMLAPHAGRTSKAAAPARRPFSWKALVLMVYAVVAVGALLRLALSLAAVARLKRSAAPLLQRAWNERLAHWQTRLDVARPVVLHSTDRVDVPVMVGWRQPAILVPERLVAADARTVDAVLLHELAHVRRGDYGWNLLLRFLLAFYWPNPLVWLLGRTISHVREQACDEVCVHWLGGAENYRATLLELADALLRRPLAMLGMAMAGNSRLQRRLKQIDASRGRAECQSRLCWRLAAFAVAASVAAALGALRTADHAMAEPTAPDRATLDKHKVKVDREKAAPASAKEPSHNPKHSEPSAPAKSPIEVNEQKVQQLGIAESKQIANEGETAAAAAAAAAPVESVKVRVEKVRREDFVVQTSQPGNLKSSRTMELYAKVAGYLTARNFNVGDRVKKGQVLAEIDASELQADLEQAKALADQAPAAVEQAQGSLDEASAQLEGAQARVMQSQAELDKARRNKEESIPIGAAKLAAAKAEVKQSEAAVTVAKARLRIAQLQRNAALQSLNRVAVLAGFRRIIAPADGIVMRQAAEPGSFAKLGDEPLFVLSGTNVVIMQTQISERDALRVAPGQHAEVWFDAERDSKLRDAQVSRVGYAIDPKTRTMPVELDLPNADDRLRPGMRGNVTIDLETHRDSLTLGRMSVYGEHSPDGSSRFYCFRVVDGRAVKTEVLPGEANRKRQEIKSGLNEGDVVIAWSQINLGDGARVEIVEPHDDDK